MIDQLLLPYEFYGKDTYETLFLIFGNCEPLR